MDMKHTTSACRKRRYLGALDAVGWGFPYDLDLENRPYGGPKPAPRIRLTEFAILLTFGS